MSRFRYTRELSHTEWQCVLLDLFLLFLGAMTSFVLVVAWTFDVVYAFCLMPIVVVFILFLVPIARDAVLKLVTTGRS